MAADDEDEGDDIGVDRVRRRGRRLPGDADLQQRAGRHA
jgi:hypothetical protein